MNEIELLSWVRGPAFQIASIIFVAGVIIRIIEILMLGRKTNLAEAKGSATLGGFRTIVTRSFPRKTTMQRSAFRIVAGYIFHIGLFVTIFLFAPHILVFESISNLSWPSLPTEIIDAFAVVTIIALFLVIIDRYRNRVLRYLTNTGDILAWLVTILPLITGYIAFHRIGTTAPTLISIHILSVELFMVVFPFTKLMHTFTLFFARWHNGAISGYRGVQS